MYLQMIQICRFAFYLDFLYICNYLETMLKSVQIKMFACKTQLKFYIPNRHFIGRDLDFKV